MSAGAAVGAVLRWALTTSSGAEEVWTVLAINVAGSFALAMLPGWQVIRRHPVLATFVGTGLLGGFTTVSAWSGHTVVLLSAQGHFVGAGGYAALTVGAAVGAAAAGGRVARRMAADSFEEVTT